MLRLVALFVYLQLILASSALTHSGTNADRPGLNRPPAAASDIGGGLDPWGSPRKPQTTPTTDAGGGLDPWG